MNYKEKNKNLIKAHSEMKKAFMNYASINSLSQTLTNQILEMIDETVKEKKIRYYLDSKIPCFNDKFNKAVASSLG